MFKRLLLSALLLASNALALPSNNAGPLANIESFRSYVRSQKPTMFLDPDYVQSVTQNSVARVSSLATLYGSVNAFTQGTDANKPILSRPDRVETLNIYSEQLDNAAVTKTRASISANSIANPIDGATTADTVVEDGTAASTHYVGPWNSSTLTCAANTKMRLSVYAKRKERDIALRIQDAGTVDKSTYANLSNCTITATDSGASASISDVGSGWCKVSIEVTPTTAGACYPLASMITAGASGASYNGDGASGVYLYGLQFQRASMQPTYIATTTVPVYGSLTGRRMLTFDGSNDYMSSTSALSDIYGASAKTFFGLVNTNLLNTYQEVLDGSGGSQFAVRILNSGSSIQAFNADGAVDYAAATITANAPNAVVVTHDGTNLAIAVNRSAFTSAASGASSALTETIRLGAWGSGTSPFNGQLGPIITFNRVLPQPVRDTIRAGLQKFWRVG